MDTPKNMVRRALKRAQFKTVNLGPVAHETTFPTKTKEINVDIIAVSIKMTPAKANLPKLISAIENEGLKGKVIIMIGGAAVKKEDAEEIGYGSYKEDVVALEKKVITEKQAAAQRPEAKQENIRVLKT